MTFSTGMLFVMSVIDLILLLASIMAYRRILRLQKRYEKKCKGRGARPPGGTTTGSP
jgi:hypothetical protein